MFTPNPIEILPEPPQDERAGQPVAPEVGKGPCEQPCQCPFCATE
jgi:hypothetical protein